MGSGLRGYWTLTWFGLISNTLAIPFIAYVVGSGPPLQTANITLAISLAWPAAVTGIVASAGLFAQRGWGVILSIVALSMTLSGTLPYGIIRLVRVKDIFGISGLSLLIAFLNLFVGTRFTQYFARIVSLHIGSDLVQLKSSSNDSFNSI